MKKRILSLALAALLALSLLPFGAYAADRPVAEPFKPVIKSIMGSAGDNANGQFYDVDGDGVPELLAAYESNNGIRSAALIALQDGRAGYLVNTDSLSLPRDLDFNAEDYIAINVIRSGGNVQIMAMRHRYYEDVVDAEYGRLYWEMGEFWLFDYAGGNASTADHWSYRLHEVADGRYFEDEGVVKRNGQPASAKGLFSVLDQITTLCTVSLHEDSDGVPLDRLLCVTEGRFLDVERDAYYAVPVDWAVHQSITNGTSLTTFSPNAPCTRGQVVTFLWRAAGAPEPKIGFSPFVDVHESDYFCRAVLWAVEQGITNGVDLTHFGPDAACTRAHVVTFLWRAHEKPAPGAANPFRDVPNGEYYTDAVLWAVKNEITNGTGEGLFSPDSPCTRGQIVTFLYRALADSIVPTPLPFGDLRMACGGEAYASTFDYGRDIADCVTRYTDTHVDALSYSGSASNLDAMDNGEVELCLCRADVAAYAAGGVRTFAGFPAMRDFSVVAAVYEEPIRVLTTDETIQTAADLWGKTVAVGEKGSELYYNALDILGAYGLSEKTVTYVYLDPVKAVEAMKSGDLCTAFIPETAAFSARMKLPELGFRFVPMDEAHVDALIAARPYYQKAVTDDGCTITVPTLLLARSGVADADVRNLLSAICSETIMAPMAAEGREAACAFRPGFAESVTFLPYHPAAAAYFHLNQEGQP